MVQENLCKLWAKDSLAIAMVIMVPMVKLDVEISILYNLLLSLQYRKCGKIHWANIRGFTPILSFLQEYFCSTLASSVYFLTIYS